MAEGHTPHPKAHSSILKAATPLNTKLDSSKLPATACGTQARHYRPEKDEGDATDLDLDVLLAEGYDLVTSDPPNALRR